MGARVSDRHLAAGVLSGAARRWVAGEAAPRYRFFDNVWIELKSYSAARVRNIPLGRVRGIDRVHVDGPVRRHSPLIVTALARLVEPETVFGFGPDRGGLARLLGHNLPEARIFWLREESERSGPIPLTHIERVYRASGGNADDAGDEPAGAQITYLSGSSATFDLLRYSGIADVVYIDASMRDVASDTDAAFGLLSALGMIVWDGYPRDPGVYAFLNRLAGELDHPVFHLLGTRLAFYSRWDIVLAEHA